MGQSAQGTDTVTAPKPVAGKLTDDLCMAANTARYRERHHRDFFFDPKKKKKSTSDTASSAQ